MATFIAIIDVLGLISAIISMVGLTGFICWVAGKEGWTPSEIIGTLSTSFLWSSKHYSKKTMMVLWAGSIIATAVFGMVLSFWFTVGSLAVVLVGNHFFGKYSKPALI